MKVLVGTAADTLTFQTQTGSDFQATHCYFGLDDDAVGAVTIRRYSLSRRTSRYVLPEWMDDASSLVIEPGGFVAFKGMSGIVGFSYSKADSTDTLRYFASNGAVAEFSGDMGAALAAGSQISLLTDIKTYLSEPSPVEVALTQVIMLWDWDDGDYVTTNPVDLHGASSVVLDMTWQVLNGDSASVNTDGFEIEPIISSTAVFAGDSPRTLFPDGDGTWSCHTFAVDSFTTDTDRCTVVMPEPYGGYLFFEVSAQSDSMTCRGLDLTVEVTYK